MPPPAIVDIDTAVKTVCLFAEILSNGIIPAYSHIFYKNVSKALDGKWTAHNVYINFKNNRRGLRTKVFESLGIKEQVILDASAKNDGKKAIDDYTSTEDELSHDEGSEFEMPIISNFDKGNIFDVKIENHLWEKIKPVSREYKSRVYQVLKPGEWTDVFADAFLLQYRLPCAFSFKFAKVSKDTHGLFLHIYGKCKSSKCGNILHAISEDEPIQGADLWLKVKCRDTRLDNHESIQRQLRNKKRRDVGEKVCREGAANCRRNLAREAVELGDLNAPTLPKNDVLRKLLQECRDNELGVNKKDGNNPVEILTKLKYTPPYVGSISFVGADAFQLHYLLPEQIFLAKEYFRFMQNESCVCLDSTSSLVKPVTVMKDVKAPAIFLFEVVINFKKTNILIVQMLSAALDTNTILFWLNTWLTKIGIVPKQAVCDYSYALLGGMCLSFNRQNLNDYLRECFLAVSQSQSNDRPATTFIRVDVAHFIAIFCRLKCFSKENSAIKDFYLRCIALMVSTTNFDKFEEILTLTLIVSSHRYDGDIIGSCQPSIAEKSRLQLLDLIASEKHNAMKLIIDEDSDEFKNITKKLESSGLDLDFERSLGESIVEDLNILKWIKKIQTTAKKGENTVHSRVNAYFMPHFFGHLIEKAKEFALWTAVMSTHFQTKCVRATSCYVEGDFGELKNNVINGVLGRLRVDKFYKIHFKALKGQTLIATTAITKAFVSQMEKSQETVNKTDENPSSSDENKIVDNETSFTKMFGHDSQIPAHSTELNIKINSEEFETPLKDLFYSENWRNQGEDISKEEFNENVDDDTDSSLKEIKNSCTNTPRKTVVISSMANKAILQEPEIKILQNGNKFTEPLIINNQKYIITNTCGFDSIIEILTTSAEESKDYFEHCKKSINATCNFISILVENKKNDCIYLKRCSILKEFKDPSRQHNNEQTTMVINSLEDVKTVSCFSNILDMWSYIMIHEPSALRISKCLCGYESIEEISFLRIDHKNILDKGFKTLSSSILSEGTCIQGCLNNDCNSLSQSVELKYNSHIIIETDVRDAVDLGKSITCKVNDFPTFLTLNEKNYRLIGIVVYTTAHYIALCRRKNGNWEIHNDLAKDVERFNQEDFNIQYSPSAVIYVNDQIHNFEDYELTLNNIFFDGNLKDENENDLLRTKNLNVINFEQPDSVLKESENWRNKLEKEDKLINETIKTTLDKQTNKKRKKADEMIQRKPSKYFKSCPDIHVRQTDVALRKKGRLSIRLLQNGSKFYKPIEMYKEKYIIANTCSFDTIIQILAVATEDSPIYLQQIKKSKNRTSQFILSFLESMKMNIIYIERCAILKNFQHPDSLKTKFINIGVKSPNMLHSVNCSSKILDMWSYIMNNEPSAFRISNCLCGYERIEEIQFLQIDHKTVLEKGFQQLQYCLVNEGIVNKKCRSDKCDLLTRSVTIKYNFHIIIDTEIMESKDVTKLRNCKVNYFPIYLTLREETYRLTGIIHCNEEKHYIALCRRINGNWERHNNLEKKIHPFTATDYNTQYLPSAVIYIKV